MSKNEKLLMLIIVSVVSLVLKDAAICVLSLLAIGLIPTEKAPEKRKLEYKVDKVMASTGENVTVDDMNNLRVDDLFNLYVENVSMVDVNDKNLVKRTFLNEEDVNKQDAMILAVLLKNNIVTRSGESIVKSNRLLRQERDDWRDQYANSKTVVSFC